jgi:hypothetical protein
MTTPQSNPYAQNPQVNQPGYPSQGNPYGQQGGYPQPHGYAAPGAGYPQEGYRYPGGAPSAGQQGYAAQLSCRFCGTAPAADVTFRAHRGLLVLMTFRKLEGPMCHSCGMQVYKKMTTETLWQGWWSPASFVVFTPFTLIWNVIASAKVKKLQASAPARY